MIAFVIGKGLSGKSHYVKGFLARTKKPFIVLDPLQEYQVDVRYHSMDSVEAALRAGKFTGKNVGLTFATHDEGFEFFAWAYNLEPHILVIEEFHLYAKEYEASHALQRLLRMGRHKHIDVIGITHRFIDMPQIVVTQCNAIIIFCQQSVYDIRAIAQAITPEVANQVMRLRDHEKIEHRF